jgi:hypothetical protein
MSEQENNLQNLLQRLKSSAERENTEAGRPEPQDRKKRFEEYEAKDQVVRQVLLSLPVRAFVRYQWGGIDPVGDLPWDFEYPYFYGVVVERRADRLYVRDITRIIERELEQDDARGEVVNMMYRGMPKPSKIERIA